MIQAFAPLRFATLTSAALLLLAVGCQTADDESATSAKTATEANASKTHSDEATRDAESKSAVASAGDDSLAEQSDTQSEENSIATTPEDDDSPSMTESITGMNSPGKDQMTLGSSVPDIGEGGESPDTQEARPADDSMASGTDPNGAEELEDWGDVGAYRLLLPTTAGPLLVDLDIHLGDVPLGNAFEQQIASIIEEAGGGENLSWNGLFEFVSENPRRFGNARIMPQQYRNMIRLYDRNRNKEADPNEVANYLFRDTGFAGSFRLVGSNFYREVNRTQSPMFRALDQNDDQLLSASEIEASFQSLRQLDSNGDGRIDISEVTTNPADGNQMDDPWSNRRASRWGDVAMDLTGYVDWSMVAYSVEESSDRGVFHDGENSIANLDANGDGTIDRDEARQLLDVPADIQMRLKFSSAMTDQPSIEARLVQPDAIATIESTDQDRQLRIASDRFQLIARVNDRRMGRNAIPREAFDMLDANNDGGLSENEIPAAFLQQYSFEEVDEDEDGKLTYRELLIGLNPLPPIWNVQVRSRGAETPDAVFSWLDRNQNHVLSTRELQACATRLAEISSDDGSLQSTDFPDTFLIQFGRGDPQQDNELFSLARVDAAKKPAWPRWAESMDANRDQDIERSEFLGNDSQFEQFDQDGDGFISPHELESP